MIVILVVEGADAEHHQRLRGRRDKSIILALGHYDTLPTTELNAFAILAVEPRRAFKDDEAVILGCVFVQRNLAT